jgi:YhcH/YjgK/YiaL family protein
MIIDTIQNAENYFPLHPRLSAGLRWLKSADPDALAPGRIELDGAALFVLVSEIETKAKESARWEAHRRYYDIQYLVRGEELIGYAGLGRCRLGVYDEAKDMQEILHAPGDFLTLRPQMFMILAPQDAHCPGLAPGLPGPAKKAIVKALV